MNNKKPFILIGSISLAVIVFGIILTNNTQPQVLEEDELASVEIIGNRSHDWGEIDINGGNVSKTFQIKNIGESNLEVSNFKTSCMCTEVKVKIGEIDSPAFGMHSKSAWKGVIKPEQTADVQVVFDPLFHGPQATGPITRMVSFNTNDPDNPTVELKLSGKVVKK